jgi:hypothetical protein
MIPLDPEMMSGVQRYLPGGLQADNLPPIKQRGMFGGGDWRQALLAAAAGFMARRSPQISGNIINGLQDAQTLKQRMALAEQQREQQFQDQMTLFKQKRDYEIANPMPGNTEYERGLSAVGVTPGTPQYAEHWNKRLNAIENPPYFYTDPATGATMMIPRTSAPGTPAAPGVTFTPIDDGGPSPGGSGGFPY